jgi:hypothetical protein
MSKMKSNEVSPTEAALGEILSDASHKKRRVLLMLVLVTLLVVWCGMIPKSISAFGVEMSLADQRRTMWVLSLVVLYLLSSFVIRSVVDVMKYLTSMHDASASTNYERGVLLYRKKMMLLLPTISKVEWERIDEEYARIPPVKPLVSVKFLTLRIVFDVVVPMVGGLVAFFLAVWKACGAA